MKKKVVIFLLAIIIFINPVFVKAVENDVNKKIDNEIQTEKKNDIVQTSEDTTQEEEEKDTEEEKTNTEEDKKEVINNENKNEELENKNEIDKVESINKIDSTSIENNVQINTKSTLKSRNVAPSIVLEDGEYEIRSAINTNKILDIDGGSTSSGARLQIWEDDDVSQQRFLVKRLSDGYYQITVKKSGKLLDVLNASRDVGTPVQQWQANGNDAQKWTIVEENGTYSLISKCSDLYLSVSNTNASNATKITMQRQSNGNEQKFYFERIDTVSPRKTLENGEYEIRSVINNNRVLDIDGGSTSNGARLQVWEDDDVSQQRFLVEYLNSGFYKITIKKSGKLLDVLDASLKQGTPVQQWQSNGNYAQEWIIKEEGDGLYSIVSRCSNLYVTLSSNNANNGSKITMQKQSNENNQKFYFEKINQVEPVKSIEDGEYEIRSAGNQNKILDIDGGSNSNGARLQVWEDDDVAQQRFIVKHIGNGYYQMKAKRSGKMLDVWDASLRQGTPVQQWQANGNYAQDWIIKECEDGSYVIVSRCSNLYLTVSNGSISDGSKITMQKRTNGMEQKFYFDKIEQVEPVKTIDDGEYEIRYALDTNKILDIEGGSTANGAKLQIWEDDDVAQQRYIIKHLGSGYYQISVKKSQKLLSVMESTLKTGIPVQQMQNGGGETQKWIIKEEDNGSYSIISSWSSLYLTIQNKSNNNGSTITMQKRVQGEEQRFYFEKIPQVKAVKTIEDGEYRIRSAANLNKVLDIDGGRTDAGARLQVWDNADVSQQRFKLKYIGNGYYQISVKKSGKMIDVLNASLKQGTPVQQWYDNGDEAQKWIIKNEGNGYYSIISKWNNLYLTVSDNNVSNGSKIITNSYENSSTQKFKFEKVRDSIGIDVSVFQGDIDWKKVKEDGIEYAFIRVGYRGWGSGKIVYDEKFEYNIQQALANGIKCGVYFYSQAINEAEAVEEANFVINSIKKYNITFPVVIDSEYATASRVGRADRLSVDERTRVCIAFCEQVKRCGYTPMVYASKYWFYDNLDVSRLSSYKTWLAHYLNNAPDNKTDYKYEYMIWQYASDGHINGISGNVDMNIMYVN